MSIEDCKKGIDEILGDSKVSDDGVKNLSDEIKKVMEVNEKYKNLNSDPNQIMNDFAEKLRIKRIINHNNNVRDSEMLQSLFNKITKKEKTKDYGAAVLELVEGGDHFMAGMIQNQESLMNKALSGFISDLKANKVYDLFYHAGRDKKFYQLKDKSNKALNDDIIAEVRIARGSNEQPTKNKDAKVIAGIIYKHMEQARIRFNDVGGNIGKIVGYEGKTRYSENKLLEYGEESYIDWAINAYDWERMEKTKGELILDKRKTASDVFRVNTGQLTTDKKGKGFASGLQQNRSVFYKAGKWEEHNNMFGETDILTNTVEQIVNTSMATGAMRVGGSNPKENITQLIKMLNKKQGNINEKQAAKIGLKLDVATGAAFVPDSKRLKKIEDIIKNVTMLNQLGGTVFTAFGSDTLTAGMVYQRVGATRLEGVYNSMTGSLKGFSKKELNEINEDIGVVLGSDPHHLGNRFEGVEEGGLGGDITHKYFMLQGLSQITDGSTQRHAKWMTHRLGKFSGTNWKNLDTKFKKYLEVYDISQKDWDIIRKYGVVDNDGMKVITSSTLGRMKDDTVKLLFKVNKDRDIRLSRDKIVGKLDNMVHGFAKSATITSDARSRSTASGGGHVKQGTVVSTALNVGMQYKSIVIAYYQKVLRPRYVAPRGESYSKLSLTKQAFSDLAHTVIVGWMILNTKEIIHNILTGEDNHRFRYLIKDGKLDMNVLGYAAMAGGGTGLYGDIINNLSTPRDALNSFIPASNAAISSLELIKGVGNKLVGSDNENIDRKTQKLLKNITPSLYFTKPFADAALVDALDYSFNNNLKGHLERNRRKYTNQ